MLTHLHAITVEMDQTYEGIISCLYTCRIMYTKLELPDGTVCFPGEKLNGLKVSTLRLVTENHWATGSLISRQNSQVISISRKRTMVAIYLITSKTNPLEKKKKKRKFSARLFRYVLLLCFDFKSAKLLAQAVRW
ncbi:hypothetical protein F4679DRAFT_542417 [Xylaria curta]|nr:hypothetical protein F4679DRAFT_542417 [Xylaria curta]